MRKYTDELKRITGKVTRSIKKSVNPLYGKKGMGFINDPERAVKNAGTDVLYGAEGGEVQRLKQYIHFYGSVSYTENMELNFELGSDDRLDMTFPPYKFDAETNKGNT